MITLLVNINGVQTDPIEKLDEKEAHFLVTNFINGGYTKKESEGISTFYPAHRIDSITIMTSPLLVP